MLTLTVGPESVDGLELLGGTPVARFYGAGDRSRSLITSALATQNTPETEVR